MAVTGLDDVTVVHGDGTTVLRNVTLRAADGELLVVLGPSGSGKSTLLRVMAGLTSVRSGEVYIGGRHVTRVPPERRNVAMVFEYNTLVPFLDVEHNLGWGLRAHRVPEADVRDRVSEQAKALRLTRLLSRKPKSLSAGERGLVGIGRALVRVPSVFLLDEPLAHLDAAERTRMRRRIVELVKDSGVTTLYVTHEQTDALAIADRVALLKDGSLVQVDRPRELYSRPANLFVAGFVGSIPIGLVPARVVVSSGSAGFQIGARTLPLWAPLPAELIGHVGKEVVLGIRPEHVHDATEGCDPSLVTVTGTVVQMELTGPEAIATVALAAPPVTAPGVDTAVAPLRNAQVRSRFSRKTTARPGDTVPIAIDVAQAHVFDIGSGQALWHPPPA